MRKIIVNLRGTNGSGKSTVARGLLVAGGRQTSYAGVVSTVTNDGIAVLGRYSAMSGGMDTVKTQDQCVAAVQEAATDPTARGVFFEGVLLSTLYGRWHELAQSLQKTTGLMYVWAFLDTPLEVCIARTRSRPGKSKSLKATTLLEEKFRRMARISQRARLAGDRVTWVDHQDSINQVRALYGLAPIEVDVTNIWVPGGQGELAI